MADSVADMEPENKRLRCQLEWRVYGTMKQLWLLVLASALACSASAFYEEGGDVAVLTPSNFKSTIKTGNIALVEFYAPASFPIGPRVACAPCRGTALARKRPVPQ